MKKVVIIGAGISGLSTALSLEEEAAKRGVALEITLIERNKRVGGNIMTERADGFLIEGGPDCFLSEKPWAMELCRKIGLGEKLLTTNEKNKKTFVLSRGKLHELPEGVILMVPTKITPLLFSRLLSLRGKLRMGLEFFIPRKKGNRDESLGDFVRRRLGQEALDKIAEPLVAGVHAGDPDTMSVRASFPKFVEMETEYGSMIRGMLARMRQMREGRKSAGKAGTPKGGAKRPKVTMFMTLKEGLSELVDTIVSRFTMTTIKMSLTVKEVCAQSTGYAVRIEGGETIDCDAVIIAAPAYAASAIIKGLDRDLSERLLTIPYVSTATVSLGYKKRDVKHPLNGFGFVVPKTENRRIMAASWVSVKFKHRAPTNSVLIRCFVGGAKNEELVFRSDEEIIRMVRDELRDIMGIVAEPVVVRLFRWHKAMPQYTIGHLDRIKMIEESTGSHPGLYLTGGAYGGIGISDCVRMGGETAVKVMDHLTQ
ncbi:MAG: protoporphyrinogen oxidase [Thermodesulfobacteriota bacterium]